MATTKKSAKMVNISRICVCAIYLKMGADIYLPQAIMAAITAIDAPTCCQTGQLAIIESLTSALPLSGANASKGNNAKIGIIAIS